MSDYNDDYANFVTVSPPPVDREEQRAPFPNLSHQAGLNQSDFSLEEDFSNLQNGPGQTYDSQYDFNVNMGLNFNDTPFRDQKFQYTAPVAKNGVQEVDSSLVSPNSSSSYDQNGLSQLPTQLSAASGDYDNSSFLFSNPNPNISASNLLSPNQFGYSRVGSQDSTYSQSAYSDVSSNANVPFFDAVSHLSTASPNDAILESKNAFEPLPSNLRVHDSFNQEISLGQSISSTDLQQVASRYEQDYFAENYKTQHIRNSFQLTENNLSSYNEMENSNHAQMAQNYNEIYNPVISIQEAPEVVARKTPSLFSNSSHNSSSSPPSQPLLSRPDPYHSSVPSSPGASPAYSPNNPLEPPNSESQFLNPEDFQNIRRGRQSAHSLKVHSRSNSRSRSRSRSRDPTSSAEMSDHESESDEKEQSERAVSAREKMLELANAPVVTKRTQIHPSLYACNLCEKRFTRPYNLKSHLRTHTDERPYICNVCGKAFARQHDKKRHEDLHSGEKKFQCKGVLRDGTEFGCSRKFARADALRRHFQTEAGKECIRVLVEEEQASQNLSENVNSGIQLPDGKFTGSYFSDIPVVSVQSPDSGDESSSKMEPQ